MLKKIVAAFVFGVMGVTALTGCTQPAGCEQEDDD